MRAEVSISSFVSLHSRFYFLCGFYAEFFWSSLLSGSVMVELLLVASNIKGKYFRLPFLIQHDDESRQKRATPTNIIPQTDRFSARNSAPWFLSVINSEKFLQLFVCVASSPIPALVRLCSPSSSPCVPRYTRT